MAIIQNNQTVGHKNGCCRLTFLGQNLTSNKIGWYSLTIGLPQEGVTYDDGNILDRAVETENVFSCKGNLATKQAGNQVVNEKTFDIAYNEDWNFVVNNISPEIQKNTMKAILKGNSIKDAVSGDIILVLGTQGQRWLGTTEFETLDTFYFLEEDGKLYSPDKNDANGDPELVANSVKSPYEKSALIMVEFLYAFNGTKKSGERFAYCMPMTSTFTEGSGTSPNSHTVSMERFCDSRSIKEYYLQGGNMEGAFPTSGTAQKSLTVKYVTNIIPTGGGEVGDLVAYVSGSGVITVYSVDVVDSTYTSLGTGVTFTKGTNIHASYVATNADLDDASTVNEHTVIVVNTAGTNAVAVAYSDELSTSGNFYIKKYDWDYALTTPVFTEYDGTEG